MDQLIVPAEMNAHKKEADSSAVSLFFRHCINTINATDLND